MSTLGEMKAKGQGVILYCNASHGPFCSHSHTPSIDQLIQYFGVDFDILAERGRFLDRFVCEVCGSREATIRLSQGAAVHGIDRGQGHRSTEPYISIEEATQRYHEREAESRRLGIKSIAELNAESRAKLKAARLAEKRGEHFIGPPNPWAHRKGRWT